jgi:glycerol-3-phosphate dehydrogenase subunit B
VASNLEPLWPGLRTAKLTFPEAGSRPELFTELLAHSLETPRNREQLAAAIKPVLKGIQVLGLPAVLGLGSAGTVHRELEDRLGVSIFEIPTLPASVPALRLKEALHQALQASPHIRVLHQAKAGRAKRDPEGWFHLTVSSPWAPVQVRSRALLLASGRFLGQGLAANRYSIRESLLNLWVHQPDSRSQWHNQSFFDPHGHAVNRAGLEVDHCFRPIDGQSHLVYENLFAAGSILAHNDWVRTKSGTGTAITTAFKAVQAVNASMPL